MLDQTTDRMWYMIGAILLGAAIIGAMLFFMPDAFASVGGMFDDFIGSVVVGDGYGDEEIQDLIDEGYIPVATADELDNVRSATLETYGKGTEWEGKYTGGLDKQYVQVLDIDLSEYSDEGWNPIGTSTSSSFKGTYDGGNYDITGLDVKGEDEDYQGLFGRIAGATIRNVGLIDNKVAGTGDYAGGLVGYTSSSTIENSYATGLVTGSEYVGGLVGYTGSSTTISNSYATGSVEGVNYAGGLVGWAQSGSTISNSYATGSVTGTSHSVGGLVGSAFTGTTITNSYWDTETTKQSSSPGGATGKTTNEMKKQATYSGWDFDNVWKIDEGYPTLR